MFIKQIIIQGFKSYKDQTVIEPFSPGTNVIVGRNGAGKSNFFAAIRFVLSDAYTQLSREERQALLHEGSGSAVMSAYVEVIFDNSDERFPTTNKEVVLRRTIALKKDEYSVDRRVTPKNEVMNMLEHAGFSRSNPYYIVPQGRVTALTNMKESDRLILLKEVAGTQVYENRRAESGRILAETSNKRAKIDELLADVQDRLDELEGEKEELRAFQTKDRERKCLEYAYYQGHQSAIQDKLDDIENYRQGGMESTESDRADFVETEKTIADLGANIHQKKREMELLSIDHRQLDEDRRENMKTRAQAEMKLRALSDGQSSREQAAAQSAAELDSVRSEMAAKRIELAKLEPDYNTRKLKEDGIKRNLDSVDADRSRLLMKQSHGQQYKSKQERDVHLRAQADEAMMHSSAQKANLLDAQEDIKTRQAIVKQAEADVAALRERLEGWAGERLHLGDEATRAKDVHSRLQEERKGLRREEEKLDNILRDARREMEQAERAFFHTMDNLTSNGLRSIRRLQKENDIPGAYGTLAELLQVEEKYRLPVEQTAGASLYHYVVDNADTATWLLQELNKQYGGRVTFMPLRELRAKPAKLPRTADAIPLIEKIEFDDKYQKAFQQVFGKTVVCPSLQIAATYTKSHGVDAITLDGDTANKRGALTGGYIDPKKSRLMALSAAAKWREEHGKLESQAKDIRAQMEQKEQEIAQARGEEVRLEQKLNQENNSFASLNQDLRIKSDYLSRERQQLENTQKRLENIERSLQELDQAVASNEALLASDFKKALSAAEERQLEELEKRVGLLQKQWNEACNARRELERRMKFLDHEMNQNLQLRLDQLNAQAAEDSASAPSGSLKEANRDLRRIQKATAEVEAKLGQVDARLEELQETVERLEANKAVEETKQQEVASRIERQRKKVEKNLQRKAVLMLEQAECAKTIRELGVLPEEAFEKYENLEPKTLLNKLQKVKAALIKYKHINKKAVEQFTSFTTQQQDLVRRRKDLDKSHKAIEDLIVHLDRRKDEAIERTFKQVSKEFATIFERLVPAGHGRLVIQRRTDRRQEQEQEDSEDEGNRGGTVDNYTGVGISVSFNSKTMDEQQKIQQLSGGQKSLCALCLIFALQQTESSPMVIFDEVDANLDSQYRTAVAALLHSISADAGTQFICTTFRPEIVYIADKCYGVTFHNKASSIDCVSTKDALEFVEGQTKPQ